jgi:hypothetical protein
LTLLILGLYHKAIVITRTLEPKRTMYSNQSQSETEENSFVEFRRKVRSAEVLSPAVERLLWSLHFTGRVSVVVQNGRVLKSGYEEGYFRQHAST